MTSEALIADLQLWVCGDYAITDSAYQLHQQYNATCQPACIDSTAGLNLPTQVLLCSLAAIALPAKA